MGDESDGRIDEEAVRRHGDEEVELGRDGERATFADNFNFAYERQVTRFSNEAEERNEEERQRKDISELERLWLAVKMDASTS